MTLRNKKRILLLRAMYVLVEEEKYGAILHIKYLPGI